MLSVTKRFEFHYAHRLPNYDGKCVNLHGHLGILDVEVVQAGGIPVPSYEGMVIDFGDLKSIVQENVIDKLDHSYLNDFIEIPTAENITRWIVQQLLPFLEAGLVRIRVYETPTSWAEWKKD